MKTTTTETVKVTVHRCDFCDTVVHSDSSDERYRRNVTSFHPVRGGGNLVIALAQAHPISAGGDGEVIVDPDFDEVHRTVDMCNPCAGVISQRLNAIADSYRGGVQT